MSAASSSFQISVLCVVMSSYYPLFLNKTKLLLQTLSLIQWDFDKKNKKTFSFIDLELNRAIFKQGITMLLLCSI
jgi:hypothetical protein